MPDQQEPPGLFGLDDPNGTYYDEGSINNGSVSANEGSSSQFFNTSNWGFGESYDTSAFYQDGWNIGQQQSLEPGNGHSSHPSTVQQPSEVLQTPVTSEPSDTIPVAPPVAAPKTIQLNTSLPPAALNTLTDAQRDKLQQIAMPAHLQYHSPRSESSPDSANGRHKSSSISSPEGHSQSSKSNGRKRKSSAGSDDDDEDDEDGHPVKKTAHNMIEKRYRTNLNDKIAALRDSVPSLRIMSKSARGEDTTEDREELQGLTPAHKLNKATLNSDVTQVLSKATEYIRHLEKRNLRLVDENSAMQQRINAFEKLFMAGAMNGGISSMQPQPPPTPVQYAQDSCNNVNGGYGASPPMTGSGRNDPQGMIQVPEDMKRIIAAQLAAGQPYPVPQQSFRPGPPVMRQQQIHQQQQQQQQMQARGWPNVAAPYFGKLMVGSLAGLMVLEAIREDEQSSETPEGRGLFAMPVQLLRSFASYLNVNFMGYQIQGTQVINSLRIVLLLCSLWCALVPWLMAPKPQGPKSPKEARTTLQAVPSLASPIHVRRQAWLTAIQTVWVPRHNFFLEAAALGLKTMKLSLRNLVGIHGFQMLTGLTEDQELARVKAWTIALDAQLAGGDVEINKSRLTLTLLASGTLPTTPLRLMLKALHIRVLLWEVGLSGVHLGISNVAASKLARNKWNEAKQLHRLLTQLRRGGQEQSDDELPDHLAMLLEQDCDEVLNPSIVQRAHNLAWNRPTEHNAVGVTDGMDTVVEDPAVRSPMDAVAAWWSNLTLHNALTKSLLVVGDDLSDTMPVDEDGISLAIRTAPVGSMAQNRALVARALLFKEKRSINIMAALQAIGPVTTALTSNRPGSPNSSPPLSPMKDIPASLITTTEIRISLLCAMAIAHLEKYSPPEEPYDIYGLIDQIHPITDMGLLGYTATFTLMDCLAEHEFAAEACATTLERLSGTLRIWTGKANSLSSEVKHQMVERCLAVTRGIVGMDIETDTGYGSMSSDNGSDDGAINDVPVEVDGN
ncbi:Clr6 histone deacetylase associated PHD protein-2 Cph2 [Diatrype stigma]|uniref:Clr6 histone deacetylase associated PHD protein-2 Cph2 n=1 Tax=Diatrype stigma TaxID=117547 RepID=A0AAN9YTC0_9PEZI